jgi:hypothetical protein
MAPFFGALAYCTVLHNERDLLSLGVSDIRRVPGEMLPTIHIRNFENADVRFQPPLRRWHP